MAISVQVVDISIPALSVMVTMLSRIALFVTLAMCHQKAQDPSPPQTLPCPLNLPTPVKVDRLVSLLVGYSASIIEFLHIGFRFGFRIKFEGSLSDVTPKNLISALELPTVINDKIRKECEAGRISGPFDTPPYPIYRISPLGVVPKKNPGEFRLIHHLSYPKGFSINDGISSENSTVSYATIDDAIRLIRLAGRDSYLAKTDIKSAFRIIPIHPDDYHLLGMKWQGKFYFDRCMPMGCRSSCKTFETLSTSVEWIARNKLGIRYILHLLDDFLIVNQSSEVCSQQLDIFTRTCAYLGIPIAPEKTVGPSSILSFAGIELDTHLMEARLPLDKIDKCTKTIESFLKRKKVTLKELQSLIGLLNFACSVVKPGRAFLRRLIDLTIGVRSAHFSIRLSSESKQDLKIWYSFLSGYNGKSFFINDFWLNSSKLNLFTDASGALGFGSIFGKHWCYGKWPNDWAYRNIAILEFFPIVLSLYMWGHEMENQCILFFTDNEALVHVINKQSCKDKVLMFFVRRLVLICLKYNIVFKAKHVPGSKNVLADSLSRLQVDTFRRLAPAYMDESPSTIPLHLQPQNWELS